PTVRSIQSTTSPLSLHHALPISQPHGTAGHQRSYTRLGGKFPASSLQESTAPQSRLAIAMKARTSSLVPKVNSLSLCDLPFVGSHLFPQDFQIALYPGICWVLMTGSGEPFVRRRQIKAGAVPSGIHRAQDGTCLAVGAR